MKTAKLIKKRKTEKKIEKLKRIVGSGYQPMFTNYMRCNTDKNISFKIFLFGHVYLFPPTHSYSEGKGNL